METTETPAMFLAVSAAVTSRSEVLAEAGFDQNDIRAGGDGVRPFDIERDFARTNSGYKPAESCRRFH